MQRPLGLLAQHGLSVKTSSSGGAGGGGGGGGGGQSGGLQKTFSNHSLTGGIGPGSGGGPSSSEKDYDAAERQHELEMEREVNN